MQADTILEWLQQEMGYRSPSQYSSTDRSLPSAEVLKKICRGNMLPVWKFLLERVKSEKTVDKIRRNIHVHGAGNLLSEDDIADNKNAPRERDQSKTAIKDRKRGDGKLKTRPGIQELGKIKDGGEKEREREQGDDSKERAMRERDAAEKEVDRLRHVLERSQKELKGRMLDLSREEGERQRMLDDKFNSRHKQVQFEAYDERCEQAVRIFAEYQRRIHRYVEHAREAQRGKSRRDPTLEHSRPHLEQEPIYATSIKSGRAMGEEILIETAQERNIRRACEILSSQLIEKIRNVFPSYDGRGGNQGEAQMEVTKLGLDPDGEGIPEEVKETAISLLKNPTQLLRAMASHTSRVVVMINRETEKIDIRADAERLRYKYENNRITGDLSVETDENSFVMRNKLRTSNKGGLEAYARRTNGQLRERQKAHVQQFMATESALNSAADMKLMSEEFIRSIDGSESGEQLSIAGKECLQIEGGIKQLEHNVRAKERQLAGVKASVELLSSEVQRLKKLCEERKEAEDSLRQKWKRIEEFDARRLELESIYTALIRANMAAAASWEQHIAAAREHSANTVIPACVMLQDKATNARDLIEREVSAVQRSPDNRLYMLPATSQGLLDALGTGSIASAEAIVAAEKSADLLAARAGAGDPSAVPSICRIIAASHYSSGMGVSDPGMVAVVDSLRFCLRPGASPASLLENLAKAVNRVQILRDLVGSGRALLAAANSSKPDYERNAATCFGTAKQQEQLTLQEWLPELKSAVQEAQKCLEDCKRVRGLVDEWWEQPAATAVDWVTVDGQNVAAWLSHVKQLQTAFYEKQLL